MLPCEGLRYPLELGRLERLPPISSARAHIQPISDGSGGSADHSAPVWSRLFLLGDEVGMTVLVLPSGCL